MATSRSPWQSPEVRRIFVLGAAAAVLGAWMPTSDVRAEAAESDYGVVDLHVDLSYRVTYKSAPLAQGTGQYPARHLLGGGVLGVVLPLYVPHEVSPTGPRLQDLEGSYRNIVAAIPKTAPYALPGCTEQPGKVRTWLAFEGAAPLASDPDSVTRWVARGVRFFGLVHNHDNALASSSASKGRPSYGLTEAGRAVTQRVFAAGAAVDVSHASDRATAEILDLADANGGAVVASHSNARALAHHPRNLTDDQLRRIAKTGGVVGVNFHSRFVIDEKRRASLKDVVRQTLHLVRTAGVDHVAIGSDFEGGIRPPPELADVRGFRRLAEALEVEGMSKDDVARIFHRNALRVLCPKRGDAPTAP